MNLQLGPQTEARIWQRLRSGKYATPDDVVIAGLQLLDEFENTQAGHLAHIRAMIATGIDELDRGEGLDGEQVFSELLAELDDKRNMK
jgi:antitoxin ParD1/3/4